jgi:hypothetical protein
LCLRIAEFAAKNAALFTVMSHDTDREFPYHDKLANHPTRGCLKQHKKVKRSSLFTLCKSKFKFDKNTLAVYSRASTYLIQFAKIIAICQYC